MRRCLTLSLRSNWKTISTTQFMLRLFLSRDSRCYLVVTDSICNRRTVRPWWNSIYRTLQMTIIQNRSSPASITTQLCLRIWESHRGTVWSGFDSPLACSTCDPQCYYTQCSRRTEDWAWALRIWVKILDLYSWICFAMANLYNKICRWFSTTWSIC